MRRTENRTRPVCAWDFSAESNKRFQILGAMLVPRGRVSRGDIPPRSSQIGIGWLLRGGRECGVSYLETQKSYWWQPVLGYLYPYAIIYAAFPRRRASKE